jgi:hypothetical protein
MSRTSSVVPRRTPRSGPTPRPPRRGARAAAEALLRELAYVYHLTNAVRQSMTPPEALAATAG